MTLHAAQLLLQKEIFKWPTIPLPLCHSGSPTLRWSLCHVFGSTNTHLHSYKRLNESVFKRLEFFFIFWVIVFGNFEWGNQGCKKWKKQGLCLFVCFVCFSFLKTTFCCYFFSPSWLFLFSPPWLEVDDHTCGPNLLKAFNKLLEKTKPSGFYSLKLSTLTLIHEYDWWQSKYETLKLNGDRIYYKPVWLPRSEFNESYTWLTEILQNTLCRACSSVWGLRCTLEPQWKLNGDSPLPFNLDISLSKHKLHE